MYKDKEVSKAKARERKQKQRAKGVTEGVTLEEGVTSLQRLEESTGIPPAVVRAIVEKRPMMEFISHDLKQKGLSRGLRYGVYGPTFDVIAELLEVTA